MQAPAFLRTRARHVRHLVRRFFDSLSAEPPPDDAERWVRSNLLPGEIDLWEQMSAPDQRHAARVALDVRDRLPGAGRAVIAAAALHDIGKLASGYGTTGRVAATLFWALVPRPLRGRLAHPMAAGRGPGRLGFLRRLGRYRIHPELGGELLRAAGADALTVAWASEHHAPEWRWTVDPAVGRVLKACDDD